MGLRPGKLKATFIAKSKPGRIALKIYYQLHLVLCEIIQWCWVMRLEYVIKMQIFYREMTQGNNVVKFNEAK